MATTETYRTRDRGNRWPETARPAVAVPEIVVSSWRVSLRRPMGRWYPPPHWPTPVVAGTVVVALALAAFPTLMILGTAAGGLGRPRR